MARAITSRSVKEAPRNQDILIWSPRCREHFLPWRSAMACPLRDSYIEEAGISDLYPGYRLWRNDPRFHLLVYTLVGCGRLSSPKGIEPVPAGSLLIVPAHVPFGYRPARGRWRFLWFHLRDFEQWTRLRAGAPVIRRTLLGEDLRTATEGFLRESRRSGQPFRSAAEHYASIISIYIERDLGSHTVEPEGSMLQQLHALWETVARDLKRPWDVNELAAHMSISASHLHRLCRQHMGAPPMKIVTRLRMERAQELLILHSHPVRVIAAQVGYQNEYAFFTAFRRFAGVTPSQFRLRR